jgi:peptidoglycan/xylan/chitin deacetylase (PgdA/CDA1 family)
MPLWKQLLLSLYYHATQPVRAWDRARYVVADRLPAIVLCWHRIADDRANPWTVSNATFARQIRWLGRHFEFVSLEEAQRRIRRNYNTRCCVSVTFDDGYAENCRQATPLLIKERIACTYFVTAQNVISGEPFQHDLAMGHHLAPNTPEQLRAIAAAGIEIGAHGYTHADLGRVVDHGSLVREVVAAKEELQTVLARPVRYLAFPYGLHANLNPAAFALAEAAGYAGVCSAYGGYNFPGDDPFHLQRIVIDDDMIRLKNWVTMDPRKLRTRRFRYEESGDREKGRAGDKESGRQGALQPSLSPCLPLSLSPCLPEPRTPSPEP